MATREEILLGYQLINKINRGNNCLYHAACHMQNVQPYTLEPLEWQDEEETRAATVEDIKALVGLDCKAIALEVETRLKLFLDKYKDRTRLLNALAHFNTKEEDLLRDKGEVETHAPNIRAAAVLSADYSVLQDNGDLLSLYKDTVELHVKPEMVSLEQRRVNSYQEIINAAAFELRGLSSGNGQLKYVSVKDRKICVQGRLDTAKLAWVKHMWSSAENDNMKAVVDYLDKNMRDAVTESDLVSLADYADVHVPQLPILRRYWSL